MLRNIYRDQFACLVHLLFILVMFKWLMLVSFLYFFTLFMFFVVGKVPSSSGLSNIKNAVVFSVDKSIGRSLPSKLGGGDLDGDEYTVITNTALFPRKISDAYTYPAAPKLKLGHPTTIEDIADFVVNYMAADTLGIVCSQHMLNSDKEAEGVFHSTSITLAGFASKCVDFVKSGTPELFKELPRIKMDSI